MSANRTTILLAGVGGQGVLTAARVLGEAVHEAGLAVVVGELHGMSQRGGPVECAVLVGPGESSYAPDGPADALVAFEVIEALRALPRVGPHTRALVSLRLIVPEDARLRLVACPTVGEALGRIAERTPHLRPIDAPALARSAGAARTENFVLLGALARAGVVPVDRAALARAASRRTAAAFHEANLRALDAGWEAAAVETGVAASGRIAHA